jgi:formylglycine-generating enzyme required for sulfatase activity
MDIAAILISLAGLLLSAQAPARKPAEAGPCARCHINDTLEWGVSRHPSAGVACTTCHGTSQGHVVEERNNVKPERLPRGAAIAALCRECHAPGCPKTRRQDSCQTCHHVHALVDTSRKPEEIAAQRIGRAADRRPEYEKALSAAEAFAAKSQWKEALAQFEQARRTLPDDPRAAARAAFCRRRMSPQPPGVRVIGERVEPSTGLPAEVEVDGIGVRMLAVAGGAFDMGDDTLAGSRPVHTVRVEPFYLGRYEVTQSEWQAVTGANTSAHQQGFTDKTKMPVENVSWHDCQAFLGKLNARVPGGGFRLPTEAEWEFAAHAGGGPSRGPGEVAWYRANSLVRERRDANYTDMAPHPVGSKPANALGFHDMSGNVWEWCSSLFRPFLYRPEDGREDLNAAGERVLRGGSYADSDYVLNPALRHSDRPDRRFRWNGLRLARTVPPLE